MKKNTTAVCLTMILPSVFAFCYFVLFAGESFAKNLFSVSKVLLVMLPICWVIFVDREKFPFVRFKKHGVLSGVLSGLIIGTAMIALYFLFFKETLDFSMIKLKANQLGFSGYNYFVYAFFLTIVNSSIEEYYWRWFAFSKLRNIVSSRKAIIITALGFTLHHLIILITYFGLTVGILFSIGVFVGGVIWSFFYDKFDSILPCVVSHLIVDAAIIIIGYDIIFC